MGGIVEVSTGYSGWSGAQPDGLCLHLLIFPCTIKSRSSLLALAHPDGPGERAVKWLGVCVCVCTTAPKRSVCGLDTGSHMYTVKWVADGQISQWDIVIVRRKQLSLSFHCYQVTSYLECSYQWTQLYFLTCTRRQPVPEHRQHITVN